MKQQQTIRLKNHEIDRHKWDWCIANSLNPSVYAESWFLDIVSPGWQALILDDYQAVFPLTIHSRFKLRVIMQPMFTQQLGIFSQIDLSSGIIKNFYQQIPFPVLTMQTINRFDIPIKYRQTVKPNYVLSLEPDYETLKNNYRSNCKRNLKKAQKESQVIGHQISADTFSAFCRKNLPYTLKDKSWITLEQIITSALQKRFGFIYIATSGKGSLLAISFFLKRFNHLTFLAGASSAEGLKKRSMFFLMDQVIRDHAASNMVLDFEGSANDQLARFYQGFGSRSQSYYSYQHHLLKFL